MSRTISERQYKSLITKSKVGWACFYRSEQENHKLQVEHMEELKQFKNNISEQQHIPTFIENEITEMIGKLKLQVSCPICLDELESDCIKFSSCGHKYCETCLEKIDTCAICKRKLYKKKSE